MRKLISAMKVSLDMKYQGRSGYADWVDAWSEDYGLTPQIDACILGGQMYRGYEQYWSTMMAWPDEPLPMTGKLAAPGELDWARAIPSLPHYVMSRSLAATAWPNSRLIRTVEDVADLKAQPGKDIYLMGGGGMVGLLLDAGLVDEFRLIVSPLIAGGPNALFGATEAACAGELSQVRQIDGGRVRLDYRLAR